MEDARRAPETCARVGFDSLTLPFNHRASMCLFPKSKSVNSGRIWETFEGYIWNLHQHLHKIPSLFVSKETFDRRVSNLKVNWDVQFYQ